MPVSIPDGFNKINDTCFIQIVTSNPKNRLTQNDTIVVEKKITNEFDIEIPFKENIQLNETYKLEQLHSHKLYGLLKSKIYFDDSLIICIKSKTYFLLENIHPTINIAPSQYIYIHLKIHRKSNTPQLKIETLKQETQTLKDTILEDEEVSEGLTDEVLSNSEISTYEKEEFTLQYFLEYTQPEMLKHKLDKGYYLRIVKKGIGRKAKTGDKITISYVGKFLNGKLFDDSSLYPDPVEFELGKPDQILKGIEKAIYKLNEGGEAIVYFSSRYGYGAEGSVSGIVGKYKSLTFAVHLKKINK